MGRNLVTPIVKLFTLALLLFAFVACSPPKAAVPTAKPTPKPKPTPPPVPAGGVVAMGRTVLTRTHSKVTVLSWHLYANRSIPNGPGQVYETANVSFCAGPQVQESTQDLTPLFALELQSGSRVAVDSQSGPGEFRTRGTINPGQCVTAPLVFQVEGGEKPAFVRFDSPPETKWRVP